MDVGVIGVGTMGRNHVRIYSELKSVNSLGIYDVNAEAAKELGKKHGATVYTSISELLDHSDAVSVVVPTQFHSKVVGEVFSKKKSVLIEKPICATSKEAKQLMKLLNASGAEVMKKHNITGATDVTGFGLAGHALKMAKASSVKITLNLGSVPLIGDTWSLVDQGCIPGAAFRNLDFADGDTVYSKDLHYNLKMIAFDAQTSGGLLMSVPGGKEKDILADLRNSGLLSSAVVGSVSDLDSQHLCLAE